MGKILLISRKKILSQAVSLYLFPHHDVQVKVSLDEVEPKALQEYDLVIIDPHADAKDPSWASVTRAVEKLTAPTLWLEEDGSSSPPKRKGLVSVRMPMEREALHKALDNLLPSEKPEGDKNPSQGGEGAGGGTTIATKKSGGKEAKAPVENAQFIELVDIVEEETGPTGHQA